MRKTFTSLISFVALTAFATGQDEIIPRPVDISYQDGAPFSFNSGATISDQTGDSAYAGRIKQLQQILQNGTGKPVKINGQSSNTIVIKKDAALKDKGEEAYSITSGDGTLTIAVTDPKGVFYAAQSIGQILGPAFFSDKKAGQGNNWNLGKKPFRIVDYPRFSWRAVMIDEARHFFGAETIKQVIDQMAQLKMNTLHWHLTNDAGWRIEIKKYPKLTQIGSKRKNSEIGTWGSGKYSGEPHSGFYTQDQIKEIIKYAAQRNITIVPEVCMPGHASAAAAAYPELSLKPLKEVPATFVTNTAFDPTNENTYKFLSDVLDEVIALFPSKVIHIGGDEVRYKEQWEGQPKIEQFMKEKKLSSLGDVHMYFTNRISEMVAKKGRRIMGWNEIFGNDVNNDGGGEVTGKLDPNAIIHFWKGGAQLAKNAIKAGHEVVNSTNGYTYLDYGYGSISLGKAYSFEPVFEGLEEEYHSNVKGLGCQMWTEWVSNVEKMQYQLFPRVCALAEVGWSQKDRRDFTNFKKRMTDYEKVLDNQGIGYAKGVVNEISESDFFNTPKIGTWSPESITEGKELTFDMTPAIQEPGEYTVTFLYTKGAQGVGLKYAALYENGKEIARDTHDAFSGSEKRNIQYKLMIPKIKEGAKYEIKTVIKGDGGNDSRGNIYAQAP